MVDVTVVSVNFQTLALIQDCIRSLRRFYPGVSLLIVDNGSHDSSTRYICNLARRSKVTRALLNEDNVGHGPALHQAILAAQTRYVFTLDSDCQVIAGGFLEQMLEFFQDDQVYAVGAIRYWVSTRPASGAVLRAHQPSVQRAEAFSHEGSRYVPGAHPARMLLDREKYLELPPFRHHGTPAFWNMREASRRGLRLARFPIARYVRHLRAGTRRKFEGRWWPGHGPPKAIPKRSE